MAEYGSKGVLGLGLALQASMIMNEYSNQTFLKDILSSYPGYPVAKSPSTSIEDRTNYEEWKERWNKRRGVD